VPAAVLGEVGALERQRAHRLHAFAAKSMRMERSTSVFVHARACRDVFAITITRARMHASSSSDRKKLVAVEVDVRCHAP
jgi:hypothetical protein